MPLLKSKPATNAPLTATSAIPPQEHKTEDCQPTQPTATRKRQPEMTKDDYWRKREERDVQRDKDMAWSGLAQAALGSVLVAQLNTDNTEDGLVKLVVRLTEKLLQARDTH